jgi:hypothetical protein
MVKAQVQLVGGVPPGDPWSVLQGYKIWGPAHKIVELG